MNFFSHKLLIVFNGAVFVALLASFGMSRYAPLKAFDRVFFSGILRASHACGLEKKSSALSERREFLTIFFQGNLVDYELVKPKQARVAGIALDSESQGNFQENPPGALDYAMVFHQLLTFNAKRVGCVTPFSWKCQDSVVLNALNFEFESLSGVVLAAQDASAQSELEGMPCEEIPKGNVFGQTGRILDSSRLKSFPNLSPKVSFASLGPKALGKIKSNNSLFSLFDRGYQGKEALGLPLLVRVEEQVFPTFLLKSAMIAKGIEAKDVFVFPGSRIFLGDKMIIPITDKGYTVIDLDPTLRGNAPLFSAKELAVPEKQVAPKQLVEVLKDADFVLVGNHDEQDFPQISGTGYDKEFAKIFCSQLGILSFSLQGMLSNFSEICAKRVFEPAANWIHWAIVSIIGSLSLYSLMFYGARRKAILLLALLVFFVSEVLLLLGGDLWIPIMPSLLMISAIAVSGLLFFKKEVSWWKIF